MKITYDNENLDEDEEDFDADDMAKDYCLSVWWINMRGLETDGQNRQNETARSANMVFLRISIFQSSHRSYIFFNLQNHRSKISIFHHRYICSIWYWYWYFFVWWINMKDNRHNEISRLEVWGPLGGIGYSSSWMKAKLAKW